MAAGSWEAGARPIAAAANASTLTITVHSVINSPVDGATVGPSCFRAARRSERCGHIRAIRTGRHMGASRPIAPPMPWTALRHYSDEDLHAVWSYLSSLKPMTNHVPDYLPPALTASAAGSDRRS